MTLFVAIAWLVSLVCAALLAMIVGVGIGGVYTEKRIADAARRGIPYKLLDEYTYIRLSRKEEAKTD